MSAAVECIDLRQLAPQRWKNGAGLTREIALSPSHAANGGFDWRASVAEVAGDVPFSVFPGIDRCIVLLHGAGMTLRRDDGQPLQRLGEAMQPFMFAGEVPLNARLIGGPSRDFNLMWRRGRYSAHVSAPAEAAWFEPADTALLLCCSGSAQVETAQGELIALPEMGCALWRERSPRLQLRPVPGSRVLVARLQRLCQDGAA